MQETLLRVWQVAPRCRPDGRPNALLRLGIRIARNLAISEARRRRHEIPADPDDEKKDPRDPSVGFPDPFLRERIERCREKLPRQPAAALEARMKSAGSDSDRDLARRIGMSLNTFLQNITRARRLLIECLHRYGIEVSR